MIVHKHRLRLHLKNMDEQDLQDDRRFDLRFGEIIDEKLCEKRICFEAFKNFIRQAEASSTPGPFSSRGGEGEKNI